MFRYRYRKKRQKKVIKIKTENLYIFNGKWSSNKSMSLFCSLEEKYL